MSRSSVAHLLEDSAPDGDEDEFEQQPTCRFSVGQLRELVTRSTERSTLFPSDPEQSGIEAVVPESGERLAAPSSPGFLAKSTAVLVLPEAPAPPEPAATPILAPAVPEPAAVPILAPPVPEPVLARPRAVPARIRRMRASRARPRVTPQRGFLRRRLFALALLGAVVMCQPWWWNVGDLRGRSGATAAVHK
jgi:hypothetical protein